MENKINTDTGREIFAFNGSNTILLFNFDIAFY